MYHANVPRTLDCICSSLTLGVALVCLAVCLLVRLVIQHSILFFNVVLTHVVC